METTPRCASSAPSFRLVDPLVRFVVGLCAAAFVAGLGWQVFGPMAEQRSLRLAGDLSASPTDVQSRAAATGERRGRPPGEIDLARGDAPPVH